MASVRAIAVVSLSVILVSISRLPAGESSPAPVASGPTTTDAFRGKAAGESRNDNELKLEMVWCPPGKFQHQEVIDGEKDPSIEVTLTRGFWIGKMEVKQSEWKKLMESEPWKAPEVLKEDLEVPQAGPEYPATYVSWIEALKFCVKLTEIERQAKRLTDRWEYTLPTEAEWEYACRAGANSMFCYGDDDADFANYGWYAENVATGEEYFAHRVKQKRGNAWGLYDVHGNVAEWCRDGYKSRFAGGTNPERRYINQWGCRIVRGGSWSDNAEHCAASYRSAGPQTGSGTTIGFRVALSPIPEGKTTNLDLKSANRRK